MIVNYFAPVYGLDYANPIEGFKLHLFEIKKDYSFIQKIFSNESIRSQIGTIGQQTFLTTYCAGMSADLDILIPNSSPQDALISLSSHLISSLNALWFVKDNSVHISSSFINYVDDGSVFSVVREVLKTDASGSYIQTPFSDSEIKLAESFIETLQELQSMDESKLASVPEMEFNKGAPSQFNFLQYNSINRITRALLFLDRARSNSMLPQKIAFYISILECLFTLDNIELSHKVSERTALFLGGESELKMKRYDLIKDAYKVRSQYVHGANLSKNSDVRSNLVAISTELDEVIRLVLLKVVFEQSEIFLDTEKLTYKLKYIIFE